MPPCWALPTLPVPLYCRKAHWGHGVLAVAIRCKALADLWAVCVLTGMGGGGKDWGQRGNSWGGWSSWGNSGGKGWQGNSGGKGKGSGSWNAGQPSTSVSQALQRVNAAVAEQAQINQWGMMLQANPALATQMGMLGGHQAAAGFAQVGLLPQQGLPLTPPVAPQAAAGPGVATTPASPQPAGAGAVDRQIALLQKIAERLDGTATETKTERKDPLEERLEGLLAKIEKSKGDVPAAKQTNAATPDAHLTVLQSLVQEVKKNNENIARALGSTAANDLGGGRVPAAKRARGNAASAANVQGLLGILAGMGGLHAAGGGDGAPGGREAKLGDEEAPDGEDDGEGLGPEDAAGVAVAADSNQEEAPPGHVSVAFDRDFRTFLGKPGQISAPMEFERWKGATEGRWKAPEWKEMATKIGLVTEGKSRAQLCGDALKAWKDTLEASLVCPSL